MAATIGTTQAARIHAYFQDSAGQQVLGPDVVWTVSDEAVATVGDSNGVEVLVNAIAPGTATLIGTAGELQATFDLEVIEQPSGGGPVALVLVLVGVEAQ